MVPIPPKHPWIGLVALIVLCFAVSGAGAAVTYPAIGTWYVRLAKPSWTPPDRVFGPVWSGLYLAMAVAAWLVWKQGGATAAKVPLLLFGVQLLLNAAWSWLFFGLRSPVLGMMDIVLLWAAIAATMVAFWRRSVAAGLLLAPYLAWVTFAGLLNLAIWQLNFRPNT